MTRPACSAALCAMEVVPQETICQLWPGQPFGMEATEHCAVGHSQLTSPTSVEPARKASPVK